ncbi:MAG: twin-arginine translocase TatA/TatE family subunit [Kiritimatiellae bacterium]|nr:twin-arginine translocase TatA/TatE family subunit [Kiritimatiellia bacterium]
MGGMTVLAFLGGAMAGSEVMLVLLVALLLFGSKNLPGIARTIGKTLEQIRRAANDVRDEVMKAEEDSAEAKKPEVPKLPQPRPPEEGADERVSR